MRAFNEFTFHVAISTVGNLRARPRGRNRRARPEPRPGGHPIARERPGHADRLRGVNDTPAPAGTASPGTTDPVASEPLGPNAWLVEEMFEQYQADPGSVSETWRDFFADYRPPGRPAPCRRPRPRPRSGPRRPRLPRPHHCHGCHVGHDRPTDRRAGRRARRPHPRRRRPHRVQHGGQPRGPHRHVVPRGPGQAPRDQPQRHQRLPGQDPRRQGQLHPHHRLRPGARSRITSR
ncbi:MAG: hypothetical protein U0P47_10745 [Acidimicrobiales bacterium]